MQLVKLIIFAFFLQVQGVHSQEDLNHKKISPLVELSAQTPMGIQTGFYNKNTVISHFFRSSYGVGIHYQLSEKWAINMVANYNHRFMGQRFYFNDTLLLSGLNQNYVIQEIGIKIGGLRTLSIVKNSNLSFNFCVEPWVNLPKMDEGVSAPFPGGINGKKYTRLIIHDPTRLQLNCAVGLRYEYVRTKMSFGFSTDFILRSAKRTSFTFEAEDYFSYSASYSTTKTMLSLTGFVSF